MHWQHAFDGLAFRDIQGDGFSVRIYDRREGFIVRYVEQSHELTLLASLVDETDRLGRQRLVFRRFAVILHVPSLLRWDDGGTPSVAESLLALDRIRSAIPSRRCDFRLVIDDEFYERLNRDLRGDGKRAIWTEAEHHT